MLKSKWTILGHYANLDQLLSLYLNSQMAGSEGGYQMAFGDLSRGEPLLVNKLANGSDAFS